MYIRFIRAASLLASVSLFVACGGGGGGGSSSSAPSTVSAYVSLGPVHGAICKLVNASNQ